MKRQVSEVDQGQKKVKKSLKSLLESRNVRRDALSGSSQQVLQDAVFQLIGHHQKLDSFFIEAATSIDDPHAPEKQHTVEGIVELLKQTALSTGNPLQLVASTACFKKLKQVLGDIPKDQLLLLPNQRVNTEVLIQVIKRVQSQQGFSRNSFIKNINKECCLPIELVWKLHKEGIMVLEAFITCNLNRIEVIEGFAKSLVRLCDKITEDDQQLRTSILADCLCYLINQGYAERSRDDATARGLKKVSCALLDNMTKKLLASTPVMGILNPFEVIQSCDPPVELSVLKKFAGRQIAVILGTNPSLKVSQALRQQSKWSYAQSPEYITTIYRRLLLPFEADETIQIVTRILEQQEVNWQAVLTFVSTLLICFVQAPKLLKVKIDGLLRQGLDDSELETIITAFLLARQACWEGPHVFPPYPEWFQSTFGSESSSPANNKKMFTFLIKFLTDIVPFESAQCLKAHILKTPFVPAKCRPVLTDYITLAKTRLADLKESIDQLGIYEDTTSAAEKEKSLQKTEEDVEKALAAFDKSGKVPSSIMEASIFRKPYFVGKFLPGLLKPRPLPDIADSRMKLISALLKAEKIPTSLYSNYEKECKKESNILLEGVPFDDDSMEDLLLPPEEQLKQALNNFVQIVRKNHQGNEKDKSVAGPVSIISEKIHALLGTEPGIGLQPQDLTVNVEHPGLSKQHLLVADLVLNTICQNCGALSSVPLQNGAWMTSLISMVTSHGEIIPALVARVWNLLTKQGPELSGQHIEGLAGLVVHLVTFPDMLAHVKVKSAESEGPFVEQLLLGLHCRTSSWMDFVLRFCTSYLHHAFSSFKVVSLYHSDGQTAVIPPSLVKKFKYLASRILLPLGLRECDSDVTDEFSSHKQLALEIYHSQPFKDIGSKHQYSLTEWVNKELEVAPHEDILDDLQRHDYYEKTVKQDYVPIPEAKGGCGGSMEHACTCIANTILDYDDRFHDSHKQGPHCKCSNQLALRGGNRCSVVHLLRTMTDCLSCGECKKLRATSGACEPWLLGLLSKRLSHVHTNDSHQICVDSEVINFFRLARSLPAHLFFQDSLSESQPTMKASKDVINTVLRNHQTTGTVLTYNITQYLCMGLSTLECFKEYTGVPPDIKDCPLLRASLIVHDQLLHSVDHGTLVPSFLTQVAAQAEGLHQWVLRYPQQDLPLVKGEGWLAGVILYSILLKYKHTEHVHHLLQDVSKKINVNLLYREVLDSLLSCISCHLANNLLINKPLEEDIFVIAAILEVISNVQVPLICSNEGCCFTVFPSIVPDVSRKLTPVVYIKLLQKLSVPQLRIMFEQENSLEVLLDLHATCIQLYEGCPSDVDTPSRYQSSITAPLTVDFLVESSNFVKKVIAQLPYIKQSHKINQSLHVDVCPFPSVDVCPFPSVSICPSTGSSMPSIYTAFLACPSTSDVGNMALLLHRKHSKLLELWCWAYFFCL